ncbi:DNA invertase Pin-like site-specific DNA recombinase [Bradyrhizobium sp. USDA 4471]
MSKESQKYSPDNQRNVIASYAADRGLSVVREYFDEGRSGLTIAGRDGLKELISDVQSGKTDFNCVLVYDVSRWGRFQNIDESAYYEFICTKSGVSVHYCAEEFRNDGSLPSIIHKCLSRAGAAKFSYDLSKRIFISQCHITELGYWRGGAACFGMRRLLIDEHDRPKMMLEFGQRKYLQSDRVILQAGPKPEVETVKGIFNSFVNEKKTITQIANALNDRDVATSRGAQWDANKIHKLLTNEAYIGNIVFNRFSYKLRTKAVANPPDMWVRRENAFPALIDPGVFAKAQAIIAKRQRRMTDQEALDRLAALWKRKGHLSHKIIISTRNIPDTSTYTKRFGSLGAAYKLIGFNTKPRYQWRDTLQRIERMIDETTADIVAKVRGFGATASFDSTKRLLTIGNVFVVSLGSARCLAEGRGKPHRWAVKVDRGAPSETTLIVEMNKTNTKINGFYMFPTSALTSAAVKKLFVTNRLFKDARRNDLNDFFDMCRRRLAEPNAS